jgi:hypothetical protein
MSATACSKYSSPHVKTIYSSGNWDDVVTETIGSTSGRDGMTGKSKKSGARKQLNCSMMSFLRTLIPQAELHGMYIIDSKLYYIVKP